MAKSKKGIGIVLVALFAALISVACYIQIPLPGGIPVVIQDMMSMLSGLLLGPVYGALAVVVFLILGCIGLPVFSGKAGVHVLIGGPTGGFLFGYLAAAIVGGLIVTLVLGKKKNDGIKEWIVIVLAALAATVTAFALGMAGFKLVTGATWAKTVAATLIPFIPGNLVKLVLMVLLTKALRKTVLNYIG